MFQNTSINNHPTRELSNQQMREMDIWAFIPEEGVSHFHYENYTCKWIHLHNRWKFSLK